MFKVLVPTILLFIGYISIKDHSGLSQAMLVADSTRFDIAPIFDSVGLVDGYKIFVFTPICEVEQCYSVQVNFYTDAIGNFLSYDTLKGQELTKLDHIPFSYDDYQRLQQILSDQNSVLSNYQKEELVKNTRESEIEGFTGATAQEIKNTVIEGAVYSCYTLWHIAHGPLIDSLKMRTAAAFNEQLIQKLVAQNSQQVNYFLIEYLKEKEYREYLPEVLQTIKSSQGYYAKSALEKMPNSVLNSSEAQQFFALHFDDLDYFAQVALLKKLDKDQLTDDLKIVLAKRLEGRNSLKEELITNLMN